MDDEALVRETLAPYLGAHLHVDMRTAASAEEALDQLGRERFALVLTDHAMSGMTGLELLQQVRERHPRVGRVLVTAHGGSELRDAARRDGVVHAFVGKPYSLGRMTELVRALVAGRSPMTRSRPPPLCRDFERRTE